MTKTTKMVLDEAIKYALAGDGVGLYEEDSMSGLSWTFRYVRRHWDAYYQTMRSESHMIFSIKKPIDEKMDESVYLNKFVPAREEAKRYFQEKKVK